jgi:hypothetical protein
LSKGAIEKLYNSQSSSEDPLVTPKRQMPIISAMVNSTNPRTYKNIEVNSNSTNESRNVKQEITQSKFVTPIVNQNYRSGAKSQMESYSIKTKRSELELEDKFRGYKVFEDFLFTSPARFTSGSIVYKSFNNTTKTMTSEYNLNEVKSRYKTNLSQSSERKSETQKKLNPRNQPSTKSQKDKL